MCTLIEEKDVTSVNLSVALETAVIAHQLQDDAAIYVTENDWFPFWVRILKHQGFIGFATHTRFKKSTGTLQRLEFCNQLNKANFVLTCYVADDVLKIDYVLSYRDGILKENFIRSCRQFAYYVEQGLDKFDPNNEILLFPGQSESEDADENC